MANKQHIIVFTFPEIAAAKAVQTVVVKDTNDMSIAMRRGLQTVRKRDGVKGRRITLVKATMTINELTQGAD